jgi:hypothetical protein
VVVGLLASRLRGPRAARDDKSWRTITLALRARLRIVQKDLSVMTPPVIAPQYRLVITAKLQSSVKMLR